MSHSAASTNLLHGLLVWNITNSAFTTLSIPKLIIQTALQVNKAIHQGAHPITGVMQRKTWALFFAFTLLAAPVPSSADWLSNAFNTVSNGISSAANTVGNGLSMATTTVGNGLNTAVNGLSTAVNGLSTAANATGRWVNTAVGSVKDAYNV